MNTTPPVGGLFKDIVSITELNKNKASKIINEVKRTGYKVILKKNNPEAVLITTDQFQGQSSLREEE